MDLVQNGFFAPPVVPLQGSLGHRSALRPLCLGYVSIRQTGLIRIHRMHFSVNNPRPRPGQSHLSDGSLLAGSAEAQNSVFPRSHAPILPRIRGVSPMISGSEASVAGRASPTCSRPARGHGNRILTMGVCLRRSAWQAVRAPALPRFHSRTHFGLHPSIRGNGASPEARVGF